MTSGCINTKLDMLNKHNFLQNLTTSATTITPTTPKHPLYLIYLTSERVISIIMRKRKTHSKRKPSQWHFSTAKHHQCINARTSNLYLHLYPRPDLDTRANSDPNALGIHYPEENNKEPKDRSSSNPGFEKTCFYDSWELETGDANAPYCPVAKG